MANPRPAVTGLALLLPATALAANPPLHVDASLKDCEVHFAPELTQAAFRRFAREFGSVSAFKQGAPPTTLGPWGFSADLEQIFFRVEEHAAAWNDTFYHPDATHDLGADKSFPKLRVRVGVAEDLDVGAFYTENLNANYGWVGVEVKYGLLRQDEDMPVALALRGAYTKTLYIGDMDMHALTADASIGRTFWNVLTPYLGVGVDAVLARETSRVVDLKTEAFVVPHATVGFEVRYWHVALGAEAQLSALSSYQFQASAVFCAGGRAARRARAGQRGGRGRGYVLRAGSAGGFSGGARARRSAAAVGSSPRSAFRKFAMALPRPSPSFGSLLGPKSNTTIARMTRTTTVTAARTIQRTGTFSRTTEAWTRSPARRSNSFVAGLRSGTTSPFSSIFFASRRA